MEYGELTEAQKAKAKECKTAVDLLALAKAEGVELTDGQLDAVSGGRGTAVRSTTIARAPAGR